MPDAIKNKNVVVKAQPIYLFVYTENGIRNCISVNSRLFLGSALNSKSALEVTQAVCNDFSGDICPIGKDVVFIYVHLFNVLYISNIAGDHESKTEGVCVNMAMILHSTRFKMKQ